MSKAYIIIFSILIALPVLLLIAAITYFCFTISIVAGIIGLVVCLGVVFLAIMLIILKKKNIGSGK